LTGVPFYDNVHVIERIGYIHVLNTKRLDATFFALSDPTRRAILSRLARGEATVAELTVPFAISQPAISRHLKVLENAGLIRRGRDAQRRPRRLDPKTMLEASAWIERYRKSWERTYHRLDDALALETKAAGAPPET
jgi:DNA-binding transcriptional ArsR family regulator